MAYLKGYIITTFIPVYKSGVFSHNSVKSYKIHAINETQARKKLKLKLLPRNEFDAFDLHYICEAEFIYSIHCVGKVIKKIVYEYEGER